MREHDKFAKQAPSHSIHHICVTENVLKIAPGEVIRASGNGEKVWEEKKICPPAVHLVLGRKQPQNDSSDFPFLLFVFEVEAHLIRSYFMCEHTAN